MVKTFPFPWITTLQGAAAVDVAAARGIFDALSDGPIPSTGAPLLDNVLLGVGVLDHGQDGLLMSPEFRSTWAKDAVDIVAIASFFRRAASDVATGFDDLAFDLPGFMGKSSTFRLFRYDMAEGVTPDHLSATAPWVDYVEALSRIEAPHLVPAIPVEPADRVLEIGGNTGVMAAGLIAENDALSVTILDLPAVCALGRKRRPLPRLTFVEGDARQPDALQEFVGKVDAILFKSVLHDWPEADATAMLARAVAVLPSGGKIIVCERQSYGPADAAMGTTVSLSNLVFAPFYRAADFYADWMSEAGMHITKTEVMIDMPFHIICGVKQ